MEKKMIPDRITDPDLRSAAIKGRPVGWLPSLGHAAGAQTQLANKDVGEGDLFLFFGWFRRVSNVAGKWQYIAGAPDLHVVFGWLQIGEIVPDSIRKLIRGKFTASELADVKDPDDKERKVEAVSPHPV